MRISVAIVALRARNIFVNAVEVAFVTIQDLVLSGELEFCFIMLFDIKARIQEAPVHFVAVFAGGFFELIFMGESMAVRALGEVGYLEFIFWIGVATFAGDSLVVAL